MIKELIQKISEECQELIHSYLNPNANEEKQNETLSVKESTINKIRQLGKISTDEKSTKLIPEDSDYDYFNEQFKYLSFDKKVIVAFYGKYEFLKKITVKGLLEKCTKTNTSALTWLLINNFHRSLKHFITVNNSIRTYLTSNPIIFFEEQKNINASLLQRFTANNFNANENFLNILLKSDNPLTNYIFNNPKTLFKCNLENSSIFYNLTRTDFNKGLAFIKYFLNRHKSINNYIMNHPGVLFEHNINHNSDSIYNFSSIFWNLASCDQGIDILASLAKKNKNLVEYVSNNPGVLFKVNKYNIPIARWHLLCKNHQGANILKHLILNNDLIKIYISKKPQLLFSTNKHESQTICNVLLKLSNNTTILQILKYLLQDNANLILYIENNFLDIEQKFQNLGYINPTSPFQISNLENLVYEAKQGFYKKRQELLKRCEQSLLQLRNSNYKLTEEFNKVMNEIIEISKKTSGKLIFNTSDYLYLTKIVFHCSNILGKQKSYKVALKFSYLADELSVNRYDYLPATYFKQVETLHKQTSLEQNVLNHNKKTSLEQNILSSNKQTSLEQNILRPNKIPFRPSHYEFIGNKLNKNNELRNSNKQLNLQIENHNKYLHLANKRKKELQKQNMELQKQNMESEKKPNKINQLTMHTTLPINDDHNKDSKDNDDNLHTGKKRKKNYDNISSSLNDTTRFQNYEVEDQSTKKPKLD